MRVKNLVLAKNLAEKAATLRLQQARTVDRIQMSTSCE